MTQEKINRINELARKSKAEGLTTVEKDEQAILRREFIDNIKAGLKAQLDNIDIENEDGSIENLGEKFGKKTGKISS